MNTMFTTLLAAAVKVETPIDGQTGVWIKSGTTIISSAMTMTGVSVRPGWVQRVYSKGAAVSNVIMATGSQHISSGGTAIDTIVSARQFISSGGFAEGTTVATYSPFAAAQVYPGASATRMTIESGGTCWMQGIISDVTVELGGLLTTYSSAVASGVTINSGGSLSIRSGGTALAVTSNAGATITVAAGGYIEYA